MCHFGVEQFRLCGLIGKAHVRVRFMLDSFIYFFFCRTCFRIKVKAA